MEYTIQKMNHVLKYQDDNKWVMINGYAFIDSLGHCMIIVYGEGRRDVLNQNLLKTLP